MTSRDAAVPAYQKKGKITFFKITLSSAAYFLRLGGSTTGAGSDLSELFSILGDYCTPPSPASITPLPLSLGWAFGYMEGKKKRNEAMIVLRLFQKLANRKPLNFLAKLKELPTASDGSLPYKHFVM